jgi:tRNA-Thr(GGU) m(6)t(6)A37 methyltransferase TsaA
MSSPKDLSLAIEPIAIVRSPFKEKFGIPRQANLIRNCSAEIELLPPYNNPDAFIGLSQFSHIWLIFGFHQNDQQKWRPLIRPPRLGGNSKMGVFATRSSFRPNGLGMSLVNLLEVVNNKNNTTLKTSCPDLMDGTPIYDIKPYINYSDCAPNADCGFASEAPQATLKVHFTETSENIINAIKHNYTCDLTALISEVVAHDPRPAYKSPMDDKEYAIKLFDLDIIWKVDNEVARILNIIAFKQAT